jgi:hypothetical protein
MDFIHHPKSEILKMLKIKITTSRKLALLPSSGEWRGRSTPILLGPLDRIDVLLFSPSIHLRTEAEPASEELWF